MLGYGATGQGNNTVTLGNSSVSKVYAAQDGEAVVYAGGITFSDGTSMTTAAGTGTNGADGADGATARVYQSYTSNQVDSFSGPQPGGCTSGSNNNCGTLYGAAWSPDSTHIVTAHGRNDEGVYYWFADIDADNDTADGDADVVLLMFPPSRPNQCCPN